jgi:methylisocitrate lyase
MMSKPSQGALFRQALASEQPLQIMGTINAYCATMAKKAGFKAIYLSGAGVANASYGIPDLGMTTCDDVLTDVKRITANCDLPLLVDIDTGWDDMGKTVRAMCDAGVAAVHFEDQVAQKRCGHRSNKTLVSCDEMLTRIQQANEARLDSEFFLMARTDAVANEGLAAAINRAQAYVEAGADGIFAEAITSEEDYATFCRELSVPVLANMTEFGRSPLLSVQQLEALGVAMALYPLSGFRAMNQAAWDVFCTVREQGTQESLLDRMQDRATLYDFLDYEAQEAQVDRS